jgi:hypothetical protein
MAELMLGQPLFPGESGIDQLVEIIKVLGTPTRDQIRTMNPNYMEHKFPQIKPHPFNKVRIACCKRDPAPLTRQRSSAKQAPMRLILSRHSSNTPPPNVSQLSRQCVNPSSMSYATPTPAFQILVTRIAHRRSCQICSTSLGTVRWGISCLTISIADHA